MGVLYSYGVRFSWLAVVSLVLCVIPIVMVTVLKYCASMLGVLLCMSKGAVSCKPAVQSRHTKH